jgi:hypothetical protein
MNLMTNIDNEYLSKQQISEATALSSLEKQHIEDQINLRQKQLAEIFALVALYSEDSDGTKAMDGLDIDMQISEYRRKLADEAKSREQKMITERHQAEEKLRKIHESKLKDMADDLEKEEQNIALGIQKMKKDLLDESDNMKLKQQQKVEEINKQNKARILSNFEKEHEAALKALENQRQDKKNKLKSRLAARRSTVTAAGIHENDGAEDETLPSPRHDSVTDSASNANEAGPVGGNRAAYLLKSVASSKQNGFSSKTNAIQHWSQAELSNPGIVKSLQLIENKLERIDKIVSTMEQNGSSALPGDANMAYFDASEPLPSDELLLIQEESLSLQEISRLRFGRTVLSMFGLHGIDMKVAASLPKPPETIADRTNNNAFRFSYLYDHDKKLLFIHLNRFSSSGDIGLVVTHAASSIKVNMRLCFVFVLFVICSYLLGESIRNY